ncbi:hypothetical protein RB653_008918 [Dictyostelium firmibasis]|uniref:folate gamma-glutamyl hydrolase n=1 Tax=Dictyostelium firmibasis TaxID=79012 RepID=A0AAN7U1D7_9MYCE
MIKQFSLLFYIYLFINFDLINAINNTPIIGILTQPIPSSFSVKYGDNYLMASYVKYIESAGARVIPIIYNQDNESLKNIFKQINGILLPGGDVDFEKETLYVKTLGMIWDYVLEVNKNGDYFPLWGTCLGLEEIVSLQAETFDVLTDFNAENYSIPLNFTNNAFESKILKDCPSNIIQSLSFDPITMNNHHFGLSPNTFSSYPSLYQFFDVLAFNNDKSGNEFISLMESKEFPIYAIIWHPEKSQYSWYYEDATDHSFNAVLASQYMANFFVNETRKSNHKFNDNEFLFKSLIYNYNPIYTFKDVHVEQIYFFNTSNRDLNNGLNINQLISKKLFVIIFIFIIIFFK